MKYTFKHYKTLNDVDWNTVDKAEINQFGWGYSYKPRCYAKGVFADDAGMVVKLTAFERNPRAVKTQFMDLVCTDSCLEFFVSVDKKNYTNFEFNALGTLYSETGTTEDRVPIDQVTEIPAVRAEQFDNRWEITLILTHKNLKDITGKQLKSGSRFYGNFYKCGDECVQKHYGMWSEIKTENPSFHQPAYFGALFIG